MERYMRRFILLCLTSVLLATTGCFRPASDANPTLQAQVATPQPPTETATLTLEPSPTEEPTPTPEQTAFAEVVPTEEIVEETLEVPLGVGGQETGQELLLGEDTPEATVDPFLPPPDSVIPAPLQTATALIQQATFDALAQTQTAQAPMFLPTGTATLDPIFGTPAPTFTPTVDLAQPIVPGENCQHQVVAGDTLFRLSLRYGVPVADIARLSGVTNVNLIFVNQLLTIPGCGTTGVTPPPIVPTLGSGAAGGGTGTGGTGGAGGISHVIQQYETLFEISLRYNVPVNTIAAANGISNINLIYMGDTLIIPTG
jgi:LysM repeat protein